MNLDPDTVRRMQQYQMMQQDKKKHQKKRNVIIIISIIIGLLLLIGVGIGLYFAFANNDNKTDSETFKVNLPDELKNISISQCTNNTCIKVGEKLSLNQILSSNNFTMTIKDNLSGIQKMKNGLPLYTTYDDFIKMVGSEESPYYLIINNKKNQIYNYYYLNNRECKLTSTGLQDGNKIIQLTSSQILLNGTIYYIDDDYDKANDIKLLINVNGIPYSTITGLELFNLSKENKVKITQTIMNTIGYLVLTNYSILVFDMNNQLIGII